MGGLQILEGAEPRYRISGLLRGEDVRADVPHRFLIGQPEQVAVQSAPGTPSQGPGTASSRLPILTEDGLRDRVCAPGATDRRALRVRTRGNRSA